MGSWGAFSKWFKMHGLIAPFGAQGLWQLSSIVETIEHV